MSVCSVFKPPPGLSSPTHTRPPLPRAFPIHTLGIATTGQPWIFTAATWTTPGLPPQGLPPKGLGHLRGLHTMGQPPGFSSGMVRIRLATPRSFTTQALPKHVFSLGPSPPALPALVEASFSVPCPPGN
jgi:hypothetical protein